MSARPGSTRWDAAQVARAKAFTVAPVEMRATSVSGEQFSHHAINEVSLLRETRQTAWIEVSVNGGWLIAYENTEPVFTTLISPGRGGAAKPDEDPIAEARTPLGVFPISGKFATATMEAPGNLVHAAVPWTQNFSGPHAFLKQHGLITQESNDYQYRFQDIVHPETGRKLFTIEHEVRSMTHPMFGREFVNRNPAQNLGAYARGRDAFVAA